MLKNLQVQIRSELSSTIVLFLALLLFSGCEKGKKLVMTPSSTAIYKVEYWPESENRRFKVYFTSKPGKGYGFESLELDTYRRWEAASSKGEFYNSQIKGRAKYLKR